MTTKNINNKKILRGLPRQVTLPNNKQNKPRYIGLRLKRYKPVGTN